MLHLIQRLRRGTRGQGLVEFALILPMIVFVMFAFFELSRAWNAYQTVTRAAREAARTYVVANGINAQADVEGVANNILAASGLDPARATFTHTPAAFGVAPGDPYTIEVEYPFDFFLLRAIQSMQGDVAWDPFTLRRTVRMRRE